MKNQKQIEKELQDLIRNRKKKEHINEILSYIKINLADYGKSDLAKVNIQLENNYIKSVFTIAFIKSLTYPQDVDKAIQMIRNCDYSDVREACIKHVRVDLFFKDLDEYDRFDDVTKNISVFKWGENNNPELFQFTLEYEIESSIALWRDNDFSTIIEVPQMDQAEKRASEFSTILLTKEKERIRDYKKIFDEKEVNFKIKTPILQPQNNSHYHPYSSSMFRKVIGLDKEGLIIYHRPGVDYCYLSTYKKDCLRYEGVFYPCLSELQVLLLKRAFFNSKERIKRYKHGISKKLVKKINKILKMESDTKFISVDESRMGKSLESWIYVLVDYTKNDISGFGNTMGVLTW